MPIGSLRRSRELFLSIVLAGALAVPAEAQLFGGGERESREAAALALRMSQMEAQMRGLTGQVEQLSFQVKQLQDQIRRMQQDTEFRLQELESGRAATKRAPAPAPTAAAPQRRSDVATPEAAPPAAESPPARTAAAPQPSAAIPPGARPGPGAPPQILGQIPAGGDTIGDLIASDAPIDLVGGRSPPTAAAVPGPIAAARPSAPSAVQPAAVPVVADPRDAYEAAYNHILNQDYERAEAGFKQFLSNHPTDRRAGSAQYWLGETYFVRGQHKEAAQAFLKGYTEYPDDPKAPDSLLKLGLSLQGLGDRNAACATFGELISKYPKASRAVRDRAASERSRARCA